MPVAARWSSPLREMEQLPPSSVFFGLTSFGRWESIQCGLAKLQVFLRSCCESRLSRQSREGAENRNMLRDVGADDRLPALEIDNLPEPAPQPWT